MIGQTLGHYKILDLLGVGGMGEVYRAEDTTLGRFVAIKVLPETPHRRCRAPGPLRARSQASGTQRINHQHIAQIHSLEDVDGQKLLVMELVDGQTLAEHISTGPIPLEDSLPIALQIAEALEAGARAWHRSSRPEASQYQDHSRWRGQSFGLRISQAGYRCCGR